MTLEEEILEACEKHKAFLPQQLVNMLSNYNWQVFDGKHCLSSKEIDPLGLMGSYDAELIDNRYRWSVDAVMKKMKNSPDQYGSLFRNDVIAAIGGGIEYYYPKDGHALTALLATLDEQAYIIYDDKRLRVSPLSKDKDGKLETT